MVKQYKNPQLRKCTVCGFIAVMEKEEPVCPRCNCDAMALASLADIPGITGLSESAVVQRLLAIQKDVAASAEVEKDPMKIEGVHDMSSPWGDLAKELKEVAEAIQAELVAKDAFLLAVLDKAEHVAKQEHPYVANRTMEFIDELRRVVKGK